jgi:hypothetical protein
MFVLDCATPCRFLGNIENEPQQIDAEKTQTNTTPTSDEKTEEDTTKNAPVTCCSLCNVEMSQTKTMLRINGWKGSKQKFGKVDSEEVLPVIICLCPKCGKIDLRADQRLNQN